jgi:hypothetical protein
LRGLWRFGRGFGSLSAGFLAFVQAALGLVGFAAEADGAAAEAEDAVEGHVWCGGLCECLQRVEAEADDLGGEAEFVLGFRLICGEEAGCGLFRGFPVAAGAGEEEAGEVGQEGLQDRAWVLHGERHGWNSGSGLDVRHLFECVGKFAMDVKGYFSYLSWLEVRHRTGAGRTVRGRYTARAVPVGVWFDCDD